MHFLQILSELQHRQTKQKTGLKMKNDEFHESLNVVRSLLDMSAQNLDNQRNAKYHESREQFKRFKTAGLESAKYHIEYMLRELDLDENNGAE